MPCTPFRDSNGSVIGIICSKGTGKKCYKCGYPMTSLCDYPIGHGNTCDHPMCNRCKKTIGDDIDVCPEHSSAECIEKTLKGGK